MMKPEIKYSDFEKLDMRIGTVVKAEVPSWSHWVMKLTVNFGEEIGDKTIFSGIMKFYKPEDLLNNQYPFVINLKPKRIGPANSEGEYEYSNGMMIMADPTPEAEGPTSSSDGGGENEDIAPILFNINEKVPNGAVVR